MSATALARPSTMSSTAATSESGGGSVAQHQLRGKCRLNSDGSVSLADIITSFHSSIREEHAWALCYQCAKHFVDNLRAEHRSTSYLVSDMQHVYLQPDGNLHSNTLYLQQPDDSRKPITNQLELISGLGCIIYNALDQGTNNGEERTISKDLEDLINDMVVYEQSFHHETDDEGIERDSGDPDGDESASRQSSHITLCKILERCEKHLGKLSKTEAESHYRAVVKALVAEALELATFLEAVASGISNSRNGENMNTDLEQLQFADWARFWVQVMSELRRGFNLKKVNYTKAPIEYELTPYEILMKDIRTCRFQLRKIMVNDDVPKVNKDARAIILDFIRSRPPLKKVSERKLPPRQYTYTPREQLMHSIRKGRKLRKTKFPQSPTKARHLPTTLGAGCGGDAATTSARRLIKIDLSQLDDEDDSDDSSGSWPPPELARLEAANLEPYDLALEPPSRPPPRRHSLSVCLEPNMGSQSVPQSRPCSRQSCASSDTLDGVSVQLPPEISKALEDNTKPWHENVSLEDRLALTLEEIVHIRIVLTKAELEALPVEGHVRGDVENRKVCFLCLKTRFGILGPWGHRCALCKRTVCSKCYSKMTIPMEHYASVPVMLLSPSIIGTPEDECAKLLGKSSANSSPQPSPCNSRPSSSLDRFRSKAGVVDRLKGSQLLVCNDCKLMVVQIIKSGQENRSAIRNKHLQTLTLNLEPVFTVQ